MAKPGISTRAALIQQISIEMFAPDPAQTEFYTLI